MINFDELFTSFIMEWHKRNSEKYTPAEIENMVGDIYEEWAETPSLELNNISPRGFFKSKKTSELIKMLKEYSEGDLSPSSVLLDETVTREDSETPLLNIVKEAKKGQLTVTAVNLLNEMQSDKLMPLISGWIFDDELDGELRELAAEIITFNPADYAEDLISGIKQSDELGIALAADILVNIPDDERIYELLLNLFKTGDNISLYASYLGKYGNPGAINALTDALKTSNYMEYREIAGAIERLGGEVDFDKDWSDDYHYLALKGADIDEQ